MDTLNRATPVSVACVDWRQRAGAFATIPEMFKDHGWTTLSFGKVFDLRTSSYNDSAAWICDGPYSWSEPAQLCGTSTWTEDSKLGDGQSHKLLYAAQEALMSDVVIGNAAIARLKSAELRAPWFVAVGVHRPHLPFIVPKRHLDLYPLASVPMLNVTDRSFPLGMPSVASECAGTFRNDISGGCIADHGSFELWQQYDGGFPTSAALSPSHVDSGSRPQRPGWGQWDGAVNTSLSAQHIQELRQYYFAAVSHTDEIFGKVIDAAAAAATDSGPIIALVGEPRNLSISSHCVLVGGDDLAEAVTVSSYGTVQYRHIWHGTV
eukprot:COSAG01_NODE_11160_length_1991_cov_1.678986_2_plen_321_part_00